MSRAGISLTTPRQSLEKERRHLIQEIQAEVEEECCSRLVACMNWDRALKSYNLGILIMSLKSYRTRQSWIM